MKTCGFIEDGFAQDAFVESIERLYPAVRFSFVPLTSEEQAQWNGRARRKREEALRQRKLSADEASERGIREAERAYYRAVARQLKSWDLQDRDGRAVEISEANIRRVQPRLLARMISIIFGNEASDIDPNWPDAERAEAADVRREADQTARPAGVVQQEHDEKNCAERSN